MISAACEQCRSNLGTFATASALLVAWEEHEADCPRRRAATRLTEGAPA